MRYQLDQVYGTSTKINGLAVHLMKNLEPAQYSKETTNPNCRNDFWPGITSLFWRWQP